MWSNVAQNNLKNSLIDYSGSSLLQNNNCMHNNIITRHSIFHEDQQNTHEYAVEPLNKGHFGDNIREVVLFLEVVNVLKLQEE